MMAILPSEIDLDTPPDPEPEAAPNFICDCGTHYGSLAGLVECQAAQHDGAAERELADALDSPYISPEERSATWAEWESIKRRRRKERGAIDGE